jgi:MFS family permease
MSHVVPVSRPPTSLFGGVYRLLTPGLLLLVTLVAFEGMAVGAIMPVAARDLDGLPLYAWGFSAFFTTSLLANVLAGVWVDLRGPAWPMLSGMGVFVAGLAMAGSAPTMWIFVLGRAVQGLGGGAMIVALYVIIAREYDDEGRPRMFALMSAAWVLPSLVGPFVGGVIAQYLDWRLVFFGLIPLVLPGAVLLAPVMRESGHRAADVAVARRVNADRSLRACAVAAGLTLLLYGAQHLAGPDAAAVAGGLGLLLLGLPRLLPTGALLLRRGLPTVVALRGLLPAAFFGVNSFIPLTLTKVHGFSPSVAGIALTVGSLGWAVGSWIQGRPGLGEHRVRLVRTGIALVTASTAASVCIAWTWVSGWVIVPIWVVAGVGMGISMSSMNVLIMELSKPEEQGANTAALTVCDTLGTSLATGLVGAIVTAFGTPELHAGLAAGGVAMTAVAILATVSATRLTEGRYRFAS